MEQDSLVVVVIVVVMLCLVVVVGIWPFRNSGSHRMRKKNKIDSPSFT